MSTGPAELTTELAAEWRERAACSGYRHALFFPVSDTDIATIERARAICLGCAGMGPLDKAVERLWFSGVTVVVAAGNYGLPDGPSGVPFAPGNDPFVITVGAIDLEGSVSVRRHETPSWSAYGYTNDGFRKPEISAAGRYMVGPISSNGTLRTAKPENMVGTQYMRLSGTSRLRNLCMAPARFLLASAFDDVPSARSATKKSACAS